jgi:hypothetical protein
LHGLSKTIPWNTFGYREFLAELTYFYNRGTIDLNTDQSYTAVDETRTSSFMRSVGVFESHPLRI